MKLRYKNSSSLIYDTVLSIIFIVGLARMAIYLYFIYFPKFNKSEDYYYLRVAIYISERDDNFGVQETFALILFIHSIRSLYLLTASRTFGPMIEIMLYMLKEMFVFLVILLSIILVFLGSMRLL